MTDPHSTPPARIVFAGTPDFAAAHLQALLDSRHQVVAVYTQPDRPAGRGQKLVASPVKQLAQKHDIPVLQPASLRNEEAQQELAAFDADLMVVVAYGLILPQVILDTPRLGCINSHASLLPRWRGAAPIQRAIEAGDTETGVTVMQMEAGLDTGPMLLKTVTPVAATDTGGGLHDRLAELGPPAVLATVELLLAGKAQPEIQDDSLANYAHKLSKDCALIDWSRPAIEIERAIRAFNPWPISHSLLQGQSLKVHAAQLADGKGQPGEILHADRNGLQVACGEGALLLTRLQLPNARAMDFADLFNGRAELFATGQVLGQ
ncbi:methionyl-tRNA formyltransferase [Thiopseudomonas denitrificans]|uniref:Methionyl-tRNA formyltransferase n=1 Tax=Thiopseudomonas denitrificans TaxID=1501432 RepID=A0A4R6TY31_9GAMM|nr:methionyl-tRNA formyltransferase [Thiopseudomonas denitrificans]TDQ38226.1 methionyl-tRNA formyltransferase [Thiopseudomonas denitrificans]